MTAHSACSGLSAVQRNILAVLDGATLQDAAVQTLLDDYYDAALEYDRLSTLLGELVDADLVARVERDDCPVAYRLTNEGRQYVQRHAAWLRAEPASCSDEADRSDYGSDTESVPASTTRGSCVADGGVADRDADSTPGEVRAVCSDRDCPFNHTYESSEAAMEAAFEHTRETGHIILSVADAEAYVREVSIEGETLQDIAAALRPDETTVSDVEALSIDNSLASDHSPDETGDDCGAE